MLHSPPVEPHPHARANKTAVRFSVFEKNGRALPAFAQGSGCGSAMEIVRGDAVGRFVNRPYNAVSVGAKFTNGGSKPPALQYHLSFVCRGRRPRRPQECRTDRGRSGTPAPTRELWLCKASLVQREVPSVSEAEGLSVEFKKQSLSRHAATAPFTQGGHTLAVRMLG